MVGEFASLVKRNIIELPKLRILGLKRVLLPLYYLDRVGRTSISSLIIGATSPASIPSLSMSTASYMTYVHTAPSTITALVNSILPFTKEVSRKDRQSMIHNADRRYKGSDAVMTGLTIGKRYTTMTDEKNDRLRSALKQSRASNFRTTGLPTLYVMCAILRYQKFRVWE